MRKTLVWFLIATMLMSCLTAFAQDMTPGTYEGSAPGFHGDIKVNVTVDAEKITAIEVVEQSETAGIGEAALPVLVEAVLANQTIGVDSVSGATVTSDAFKSAMTAALTAAGADMEKFTAAVAKGDLKEETLNVDVVVVGAGVAGLTAASYAQQQGLDTILLEKTGMIGGASAMAGGGTKVIGSKITQADSDFEADRAKFIADMLANGHNNNHLPTVELYADSIGPAFDWVISEDGAAVPYTTKFEGRGAGVAANLNKAYERFGGKLMVNTPAIELIVNDGAVAGVIAQGPDTLYTINAKAVILASGGYGANKDLVPEEYLKFVYAGHAGAEGDAIKMVESLNADLINMQFINTQPNSMIRPSGLGQYCNPGVSKAYAAGGFMVNQDGVRFVNETTNAWDIMQEMKKNDFQYLVMDKAAFDGFNEGMTGSAIYTMEDVAEWLKDDYAGQPKMKTAESLEALADKIGVPADAVLASAKAFNEVAAAGGEDEFGRKIAAAQSTEGPFYALEMHIRYYASLGGLHINNDGAVLNTTQEAIPGLYAAGEVVGGLQGDVYMGGTLFGWAIASGHNAAVSVVETLTK